VSDAKQPTRFDQLMNEARQAYATAQPDRAIAALGKALGLARTPAELRLIAGTHRRFGRLELAADAFRRLLQQEPGASDAHLHLALMRHHDAEDDELGDLLAVYAEADASQRIPLGFALGKIYEDFGQVDRAAGYYAGANAARRAVLVVSIEAVEAEFAALKAAFSPALFARFAKSGNRTEQPIFIVGMPRSGSTLTEHILASHPDVLGGGEMNLIDRLEAAMLEQSHAASLIDFVGSAAPSAMEAWANAYLAPVRQALAGKHRFTDKNLDNFRRIGLIRLLFPQARIVHCVRDPLDTCFSIWRRLFGGDSVPFGYDQAELGRYFALYRDLMGYWREALPGFIYDQRYEELVAAPEPAMRQLLEFCRLPWNARVLDFHKTERGIATASAAQVRQPVYADSIGAARAYMAHLGPLLAALGD
jgi:tetratricopeptide (TPR) repeat protein